MNPTTHHVTPAEEQLRIDARRALRHVRERAWAFATGALCAVLLSVATLVLVMRGGSDVGAHLGLLSVFLPGYSVSYVGVGVGFVYAFVIGWVLGWLAGRVYNLVARDT